MEFAYSSPLGYRIEPDLLGFSSRLPQVFRITTDEQLQLRPLVALFLWDTARHGHPPISSALSTPVRRRPYRARRNREHWCCQISTLALSEDEERADGHWPAPAGLAILPSPRECLERLGEDKRMNCNPASLPGVHVGGGSRGAQGTARAADGPRHVG